MIEPPASPITLELVKVSPTLQWILNHHQVRIWSAEHRLYWRPNASGYTSEPSEAGVYPFPRALRSTKHCGPEKAICFEVILPGELPDYEI